MPAATEPKALFTSDTGRGHFPGLVINRRNGDLHLLPVNEITWASATALPDRPEAGLVEIQTRHRVIRLALGQLETAREFLAGFYRGNINRVHEGTAVPFERSGYSEGERDKARPVTLAVEIIELSEDGPGSGGNRPVAALLDPPPARPGLGFPTL